MNAASIEIKVTRKARREGVEPTYNASYKLPMGDATAADAETFAAMAMKGLNAQLDYSKSTLRLAVYDTETGERLVLKEKD